MFNFLNKLIIGIDAFGYTYEWSFKEKQGKYKTRLGGFATVIINAFIIQQTYTYAAQIFNYANDTVNASESSYNEGVVPVANFTEMNGRTPFYNIQKSYFNLKKFDEDTGDYSGDKPDLNLNKIKIYAKNFTSFS